MSELFPELFEYLSGISPELAKEQGWTPGNKIEQPTIRQRKMTDYPEDTSKIRAKTPWERAQLVMPASGGMDPLQVNTYEPADIAMGAINEPGFSLVGKKALEGKGTVFYSKLRELIEESPQDKFDAPQLKNFLNGKVSVDELETIVPKLDEGGKVTKADLLGHLDKKGLQLLESRKTDMQTTAVPLRPDPDWDFVIDDTRLSSQQKSDIALLQELGLDLTASPSGTEVAFADRGGEFLMTVDEVMSNLPVRTSVREETKIQEAAARLLGEGPNTDLATKAKFSQYQVNGGKGASNYREVVLHQKPKPAIEGEGWHDYRDELYDAMGEDERYNIDLVRRQLLGAEFYPSEEPLAQSSMDKAVELMGKDWVDAYGKVLNSPTRKPITQHFKSSHFSEKGYQAHLRFNDVVTDQGEKATNLIELQSDLHQKARAIRKEEIRRKYAEFHGMPDHKNLLPNTKSEEYKRFSKEVPSDYGYLTGRENLENPNVHRVPNSPFKKSWESIGMKKALREAAEDPNSKYLTWNSGAQQDKIYKGYLDAEQKAGMKKFYDEMLPSMLEKWASKYGVKVQTINIPKIGTQQALPLTEEMRYDILKGLPLSQADEGDEQDMEA